MAVLSLFWCADPYRHLSPAVSIAATRRDLSPVDKWHLVKITCRSTRVKESRFVFPILPSLFFFSRQRSNRPNRAIPLKTGEGTSPHFYRVADGKVRTTRTPFFFFFHAFLRIAGSRQNSDSRPRARVLRYLHHFTCLANRGNKWNVFNFLKRSSHQILDYQFSNNSY